MKNGKTRNFEEKLEKVEKLFEDYRKSGLGLMSVVIGLSSGAFIGLFNDEKTYKLSFLYLIPIGIAIIQQLTYYLGSHKRATYKWYKLITTYTNNPDRGTDAYVSAEENLEIAKLYSNLSYIFSWLACLSLGIVTAYFLILLSPLYISITVLIVILSCLCYWGKRVITLRKKLKRTE